MWASGFFDPIKVRGFVERREDVDGIIKASLAAWMHVRRASEGKSLIQMDKGITIA